MLRLVILIDSIGSLMIKEELLGQYSEFKVSCSFSCRFFFFYCFGDHRDLHSFPTRRSSDLLPAGTGPAGLSLSWPILHARITQLFGPTGYVLEPPLGPYPHFHTGIDLAAASGSPVLAAADGVVVGVAHTNFGYGNYVIIAHGGGVLTLYAHLLETDVVVGQQVVRTQLHGR